MLEFKTKDAGSYDAVAEGFDRFSQRMSLALARRCVALASLSSADRVLDVGTGTGIVALEAAGAVGHNGSILGIDLSDGMLHTAIRKAQQRSADDRVTF